MQEILAAKARIKMLEFGNCRLLNAIEQLTDSDGDALRVVVSAAYPMPLVKEWLEDSDDGAATAQGGKHRLA